MASVIPNFGMSGATTRRRARGAEQIMLRDGFEKIPFFSREAGSISEGREVITAWGLEPSSSNPMATPLESVSLSETEEVVTHDTWTGTQPSRDNNAPKLLGVDAMLIVSAERRLTVTGKGNIPTSYKAPLVGSGGVSLTFKTAIGSETIVITDALYVSLSDDASLTDFTRWSMEFLEYLSPANGEDGSRHLITVTNPVDVLATLYQITRTTTFGMEAWATQEISITEFFGTSAATDWPNP